VAAAIVCETGEEAGEETGEEGEHTGGKVSQQGEAAASYPCRQAGRQAGTRV